jgi:hypothetical protein
MPDGLNMKGALVFLAVFAIVLIITLGNTNIPPGQMIYKAVLPNTEAASGYLIGGTVDAVTAIIAVFNGVIYGFIVWIIFTLATMGRKKDKNSNVVVNINNQAQTPQSPPPPPQ